MVPRSFWLWSAAVAVVAGGWALEIAACGENAPEGWRSGVGVSALVDPEAAGDEAAGEAKASLGGTPAKFVLVGAAAPQLTPELLAGVTKHFDPGVVYGCQVASPLVADTNFPDTVDIDTPVGVCVWAVGGDADVAVATQVTDIEDEDAYFSAGSDLGAKLRGAVEESTRPGKIIVTFGDQYNGSNIDFALGLNEGLGKTYPIIGAAAGNATAKEIVKGEIVTGTNIALLLAGDFKLGQAMNGGTHTPETADRTLAAAIADGGGGEPFFALIFNCRRRRAGMIERKQLAEELDAIRRNLPGVEFFGFYGPGEIGSTAGGEPAKGVGFTVVTAVFFRR